MDKIYPSPIGRLLGIISMLGYDLHGAVRNRKCLSCGARNIPHEARANFSGHNWVAWEAVAIHRAACGLRCSNGLPQFLKMSERRIPVEARVIHDVTGCPGCAATNGKESI